MMHPKIIKNEAEYEQALLRIEELLDSRSSIDENDELELYATLVELYEEKEYEIELPDPIEAIKFRMEQENLKQVDLVPYIGNKSKVSEVLNRKRSLSLSMIRSLNEGLNIPAEVLIRKENSNIPSQNYLIKDYPFNEMFKRGYFENFKGNLSKAKEYSEELLTELFKSYNNEIPKSAYFRQAGKKSDQHALDSWIARVQQLAAKEIISDYNSDKINFAFLNSLSKLSFYHKGPELAKELLNKSGIHLIILKKLPKTYFDGVVFYSKRGNPIIGLTLRYGRVDNFWFTLLHEMSHVMLHLNDSNPIIIDDFNDDFVDAKEIEANTLGQDALIDKDLWAKNKEDLLRRKNIPLLIKLSDSLNISPAIIAGRVRRTKKDYRIYSDLVNEDIRYLFDY
ncbi:MAG: ImmA/IrrE family metallo-endopeptidase [Candidatus Cloacimonadales bacterium]